MESHRPGRVWRLARAAPLAECHRFHHIPPSLDVPDIEEMAWFGSAASPASVFVRLSRGSSASWKSTRAIDNDIGEVYAEGKAAGFGVTYSPNRDNADDTPNNTADGPHNGLEGAEVSLVVLVSASVPA